MATITFGGQSYTVDHAVKGADYVHGYDATGNAVVCIDGVSDFALITYDGEYMSSDACASETRNIIKCVNGIFVRQDGSQIGAMRLVEGVHYGDALPGTGVDGQIFFKRVSS